MLDSWNRKFKCRFQIKRVVFRCNVDIGNDWIININFDKLSLMFGFSVCKVRRGYNGLTLGIGTCKCRFQIKDMFFKSHVYVGKIHALSYHAVADQTHIHDANH